MTCAIVLILAIVLVIAHETQVANAESEIDVKTSIPDEQFTIGIPKLWSEKIFFDSQNRRVYAFWENGNAITIAVKKITYESYKKTLKELENMNDKKLAEMENSGKKEVPSKLNVKLSLETVANQKAFVQTYVERQESLGKVMYIGSKTYDFVYNGSNNSFEYRISISAMPANNESNASKNFSDAFEKYFRPIIISFFPR